MERTLARELSNQVGKAVYVRGFLNQLRLLGKVAFLVLRDRSGFLQIVIENSDEIRKVAHLQIGSVLSIEGKAVESREAALRVEIIEPKILVENPIREVPPLEYNKPEMHNELDFILDHRTLALRNRKEQAVFRLQAELAHAYRLFMHDTVHAIEYFSPNMLGASSEGGAEFFNVDYFGHTATLAQSSQLYKQIMVGVNERVFALAPFFRAEPSQTSRHISEGKQFEFEMGFFKHWHEILDIQEACIKFMVSYLQRHCKSELETLGQPLIAAPEQIPFPRIPFAQAQQIYFERTGIDERQENDLSPAAERQLCAWAQEKFGTDLIFITDWKTSKRPFYAYPKEEDPQLTNTFDLLCAGTEITSGGQRRHTYESMLEGLKLKEMNPDHFEDYLSIFKYGMPPHGGFGMGLERLTMTLLKLKNIREASLFPSDPKRIAGVRLKAHTFFGGENIRNEIIRLCREKEFEIRHLVHEATPTSEDSARVRNLPMELGVKSLILRGKSSKKNYQFNIPGHRKLDVKAAAELVGEKCEFESPEIILERFGLIVGGVPPFGNLLNLDNYFDLEIQQNEMAAFNCGLPTESIEMRSKDLLAITDPKFAKFTKP
ncbi:MAG: aspartate--tRNA(Asn) ligase [Chlamydiia bacterium]|nr:aspartate--tRNA(Asn) ligase [Chlamydiia bacterium]